jgi:hypothetical protein
MNGDDGGVSRFSSASKRSLPVRSLKFADDDSDGVDAVDGSAGEALPDVGVNLPRESLNLGRSRPLLDVASVLLFYCSAVLLVANCFYLLRFGYEYRSNHHYGVGPGGLPHGVCVRCSLPTS